MPPLINDAFLVDLFSLNLSSLTISLDIYSALTYIRLENDRYIYGTHSRNAPGKKNLDKPL